jgi:hypothetical protein
MNRFLSIGLSVAAAVCLLLWGFHYASFDLWGDELISLQEYALAGFTTTVTKYLTPNNHILFNLMNGVVSDLLGVQDLYRAMDRVQVLRWLQWPMAVGTCLYVFLVGRRFFSSSTGVLALVFLVTCLPFLNFTMQLRGYGLSMLLAAGLAYHTWSAEERQSWTHLLLISIATFGILYVIPSNIYFAAALGVLVAWRAVWPADESEKQRPLWRRRGVLALAALGTGFLLALLAYLPVLTDLINNRFAEASPDEFGFVLFRRLPQVALGLVSMRYLLIPVVLGGFFFALRKGESRLPGSEKAAILIALLFLPFLFSFLRNDEAFQRTFIFLAPIFSLALGAGVFWCLKSFGKLASTKDLLSGLIAVYAFGTLGFAHVAVQGKLRENLRSGIREQTILANYHQFSGFRPSDVAMELARVHEVQPGPVLVVDGLDPVALGHYLLAEDLSSTAILRVRPSRPGENGTHIGQFQEARDRDEPLAGFWINVHLSGGLQEGDLLTPALSVAERLEPSDSYYVVTAFPEKTRELFRAGFPLGSMETVVELEGFAGLRVIRD